MAKKKKNAPNPAISEDRLIRERMRPLQDFDDFDDYDELDNEDA